MKKLLVGGCGSDSFLLFQILFIEVMMFRLRIGAWGKHLVIVSWPCKFNYCSFVSFKCQSRI